MKSFNDPNGIAESFGAAIFGLRPSEAIEQRICIDCKKPLDHTNLRCSAEVAEYQKTGLCGRCFDRITLFAEE